MIFPFLVVREFANMWSDIGITNGLNNTRMHHERGQKSEIGDRMVKLFPLSAVLREMADRGDI
jgi:hypothetical protein